MAQFIRVGTNGILGIPADKISPIIVCRLKKLLTRSEERRVGKECM